MNILVNLKKDLTQLILQTFNCEQAALEALEIKLNLERIETFGDVSCNAALILAKVVGKNPRQIAMQLQEAIEQRAVAREGSFRLVQKIELAGPGFINLFLDGQCWPTMLHPLIKHAAKFFALPAEHKKLRYHLEFVSANPTGPVHLGGGRGGIIGDVLARVLRFLGHEAHTEYYINDAGNQIRLLGQSFQARCLQLLGKDCPVPEGGYAGDYLLPFAEECVKQFEGTIEKFDEDFFAEYVKDKLLLLIKQDLIDYGVEFDQWFSEKRLHVDGSVDKALELLKGKGLAYEQDGALWFKATDFGDDKDRVLRKTNGELTYIAADIAYHKNKFDRGYDVLIDILGQDHHGYVKRLKATMEAIGYPAQHLDIIVYQLVTLKENDEAIRMSKRAGTFTKLSEVVSEVGKDVARYFYLNRRAEAHLEFDLAIALKKTDENPVFYLQYGYVRCLSVLHKAKLEPLFELYVKKLEDHAQYPVLLQELYPLFGADECALIKKMVALHETLWVIATSYQTHMISYYAYELATMLHTYYAQHKIINTENEQETKARLALVVAVSRTLAVCLDLLGVSKPERM